MMKGPTGVFKSVLDTTRTDGKRKEEIFLDVIERVTCVFNAAGYTQSSQIDGAIQVRDVFCISFEAAERLLYYSSSSANILRSI